MLVLRCGSYEPAPEFDAGCDDLVVEVVVRAVQRRTVAVSQEEESAWSFLEKICKVLGRQLCRCSTSNIRRQ